jgi:tetratricopeptide repeat protein
MKNQTLLQIATRKSQICKTTIFRGLKTFAAVAAACLLTTNANANDPKRGDPAPKLALTTIDNRPIATDAPQGSIHVFLFGRTDQKLTDSACEQIDIALESPPLQDLLINWVVVLSKSSNPEQANASMKSIKHHLAIVHDSTREVFGAYSIIALPTVVIVDSQNRFVHFMPGLSPRFTDIFTGSVLLAAGQIDAAQFEQILHPDATEKPEARIRAERIVKLARHASKRGLYDMALSQYRKAQEIDPTYLLPRLAAGYLLLKAGELDAAEKTFQALLESDPESADAALGLATVYTARRGVFLAKAELLANKVLGRDPKHARAHFVMGLVFQARGESENAADCFKKASELLLDASNPDIKVAP